MAEECGDGQDNDCNGLTDEEGALNCTDYYFDADGDNYGSGPATCACSAPSSDWATLTDDCNDNAWAANPGQSSFFTTDRGDGSFDYNCDGNDEKFDQRTGTYSCSATTVLGLYVSCSGNAGWMNSGSGPSCGGQDVWVGACYLIDTFSGCGWPADQYVTQSCR